MDVENFEETSDITDFRGNTSKYNFMEDRIG